jgi:hypothetical protein
VILFLPSQIACLKAALAKKEGEPENILSTQSSPSIYRIRKRNATPVFPKDRQPMEEVGNLEVIFFQSSLLRFLVNFYFFHLRFCICLVLVPNFIREKTCWIF